MALTKRERKKKMKRKNHVIKYLLCAALAGAVLVNSAVLPAAAAEDVTVTGTTEQTKDIEMQANIQSVYSVTLPATISLSFGTAENESGEEKNGYFATIKYGCAGLISSTEDVYIEPQFPAVLTGATTGATINITEYAGVEEIQKEWDYLNIGTCDYDGSSLSNCVYSCCEEHKIGVALEDVSAYELYEGTLTFKFGIR